MTAPRAQVARFNAEEAAAEEGPAGLLARVLRGAGWPAALIVACGTLIYFVPPIRSASSEPAPAPAPAPVTRPEFDALRTDVTEMKQDVREIRGVLLNKPPR